MYDELLRAMEQYFDEVKVLKRGARGTVTLVRHRQTGQRYVFRRFDGAADVYRRLLTVSSPYLPRWRRWPSPTAAWPRWRSMFRATPCCICWRAGCWTGPRPAR